LGHADAAGGLVGEQRHELLHQAPEGRLLCGPVTKLGELVIDERVLDDANLHGPTLAHPTSAGRPGAASPPGADLSELVWNHGGCSSNQGGPSWTCSTKT